MAVASEPSSAPPGPPAAANPPYRGLFLIAALASLAVGVMGLLDLRNQAFAGYAMGRNKDVVRVVEGSPAEQAGLRVGDIVLKVGGIPIEDTKARVRRTRPTIGEVRTYVVERAGAIHELDVTFGPLPAQRKMMAYMMTLVGLCFLGFCLWAYFRTGVRPTFYLALFGICLGTVLLPGPYWNSFFLRTLSEAVAISLFVIGSAVLVHYLLQFPERRSFLDRTGATRWIYGPAIAMLLFVLSLIVFQPEATRGLKLAVSVVAAIFVTGYFGWSLATMLQGYLRATPDERRGAGLGFMLAATVVGLVPIIAFQLLITLAPSVYLPAFKYADVALGLIPVAFALAAVRRYRTA